MSMSALQAADNAVKKIQKDYKPIVDLSESLEEISKALAAIGDLEAAQAKAKREADQARADLSAAESKLRDTNAKVEKAAALYEDIKKKLEAFRA